MGTPKISIDDVVTHKAKNSVEMLVIKTNGNWVTSEYADVDGERVEKVYDKEFLVVVREKSTTKRNPLSLRTGYWISN